MKRNRNIWLNAPLIGLFSQWMIDSELFSLFPFFFSSFFFIKKIEMFIISIEFMLCGQSCRAVPPLSLSLICQELSKIIFDIEIVQCCWGEKDCFSVVFFFFKRKHKILPLKEIGLNSEGPVRCHFYISCHYASEWFKEKKR